MRLVFDLECDNYLESVTKIHCISARDIDTDKVYNFRPSDIKEGLSFLNKATMLIGHNIIGYDLPVIKKLFPLWVHNARIYDTLIAAKYAFPDIKEIDFSRLRPLITKPRAMRTQDDNDRLKLIGRHSLEAYGDRLGEAKGDFGKEVGFEIFSEPMLQYCEQDVLVNTKLYFKLVSKELDDKVLDKEFRAKEICVQQELNGFQFDIDKAYKLLETINKELEEVSNEIISLLGGSFIIDLGLTVPKRTINYKDVLKGNTVAGAAYHKIKVKPLNPTSRHDLGVRLIERFGWKPTEYGKDGKPTLSEEELIKQDQRIFKLIAKQMMLQKRLGMLESGKNAWIKMYNKNTGAIHGGIDTLGTGTHRCTHMRPNLGQIPSTRTPYGKECRELFTVPKGMKLFGTDASGLELRMLAHFMALFDDGEYADLVVNGDVHTRNQEAAGLDSRDTAKTFMYAKLYGSGKKNLAKVCDMSIQKMGKVIKDFDTNLPALKMLCSKLEEAAEARGYVISLDGRRIPVRSLYSALNFLLQSSGAVVCKYWMVEIHDMLIAKGLNDGKDYLQQAFVHDELQIAYNPKTISHDELDVISKQAMKNVAKELKLRVQLDSESSTGDNYSETH